MKNLLMNPIDEMCGNILKYYSINEYKSIREFAENDVDLSGDVSSEKSHIDLNFTPYLIEPLSFSVIEPGVRKVVTFSAPEQMGKTTLEIVAILYNVTYQKKIQAIVAYPSLDLAIETSHTKFVPLFRRIPQFAADIDNPFAIRSDRLKLSNALIYWQGGGVKIVSKSCKLTVADECAVYSTPNNVNNLEELIKRTRSYNECLSLFVSTPSFQENAFWQKFLEGSQGYFHLRCLRCGKRSIRSCDIHNLQFESVYDEEMKLYVPLSGSARLECPQCHFQHTEDKKNEMILDGKYIHKFPDRLTGANVNASFQAGVLASMQKVHSWDNIAARQLASGTTADLDALMSWDNSYRGLPFHPRAASAHTETEIQKHLYKSDLLKKEDIEAIYVIADTQDTFSVVGVFALTRQNNFFLVSLSRPRFLYLDEEQRKIIDLQNQQTGKPPETTVYDMLNREYFGIRPLMLLIDWRGHRQDEVRKFSALQKNIAMYAGTVLRYEKWRMSDSIPKLITADAKKFQAEAIFTLYHQKNRESGYLYLSENITTEDIAEILAVQPDREKRNGSMYENWTPGDKVHDVFDVLKMFFCALRFSVSAFRPERFLHGEATVLKKKLVGVDERRIVKQKPTKASWLNT